MSNWVAHLAFKPAVLLVVGVLLSSTIRLEAQMVHRLKGSIRDGAGSGLPDVVIRAEAVTGFRGQPFAGAKEHTAVSTLAGEWSMTGLESGLWIFSASAPTMVPSVVVLPVKLSQRQQVSAIGNSLTWQLPLSAARIDRHQALALAAELIASRKVEEAVQALTVALGPNVTDDTRVMAGEMALLAHNAALANALFAMVLQADPKHPRATLGAACATPS